MTFYSVWAPHAERVELVFLPDEDRVSMVAGKRGMFSVSDARIKPGQSYAFSLDGGPPLPDPRSALQPEGVHGPSCWVDFKAFEWRHDAFQQCPLASAVIYELHVGTFSEDGTFEGAIAHLPKLKALGVTHVEIMPVAHFPGTRGWGYDGVCLFAPHTAYGGPAGLARFVDACHGCGMAVLLDVVYNHLGPSGNYLGQFGPYFTDRYHTPWGEALNYDDAGSDEVRRFICDNAKFWLRNYHIDGLRLDAIHAIYDHSATHVLAQLASEVDALSTQLGRHLILIAESGLNDARIVRPQELGGYGLHSQWSDDFHHALHSVLTKETSGYYSDFGQIADLAAALRHGFVFRGQYSAFRNASFGGETVGLRGRQLVGFNQNHDQIGNRAVGDRLSATLNTVQLQIAAALTLLSPFVPLLFMGEEWGCAQPFQYFVDHEEPELREAVRHGRQREFMAFGWEPEEVPDPGAIDTFERSKLDWQGRDQPDAKAMLDWYQELLRLRRSHPSLTDDRLEATEVDFDEDAKWLTMRRARVLVACSFSTTMREWTLPEAKLLLSSGRGVTLQGTKLSLTGPAVAVLEQKS